MKKVRFLLISFACLFFLMLFKGLNVKANEYYIFDVKSSDVSLIINSQMYTSDENNQIKVEKNDTGIYIVSSNLLKEKTYTFLNDQIIEIDVPKSITIDDENSVFDADSTNEWKINAIISFYDETSKNVELSIKLTEQLGDKLVFRNVDLFHDDYNIEEKVTLRRITSKIEEYKEKFVELNNSSSDFKNKVNVVKEKFDELELLYTEENFDMDTLYYYDEYLKSNSIGEYSLSVWLDSIVENVKLKNDNLSVVYGNNVVATIIVETLNGMFEREIQFDYTIDDIFDETSLKITSIDKLEVCNSYTCTYSEYVSYNVNLLKRKLYGNIENSSVIYNGSKQDALVEIVNVSEKFHDFVSNEIITYFVNGEISEPINVNTYEVNCQFDITNKQFYDFSEFAINNFIIEKATIDNILFENKVFTYTGEKVDFGVNTNILSDGKKANVIYKIDEKLISSIISAGVYTVEAIIENANYETAILTAQITVNKAITSLGYANKYATKEYDGNDFDYRISKNIYEDGSIATIEYEIFNNGKIVDKICAKGEYRVVVTISDDNNNFESKTDELHVTITSKPIYVDYIGGEFMYDGKSHSPTIVTDVNYTTSYSSVNGLVPVDAGTYTLIVTSADPDYTIINNIYEFTISPVKVKFIGFVNMQIEYCNCNIIEEVKIANIYNNDDVTTNIQYKKNGEIVSDIKNVYDSYVVEVYSLSGEKAANYTLKGSKTIVEVKVVPKNIVITPTNAIKEYSDQDPQINYTVSPSLYENDTIIGNFSRDEGETIGKYKLHKGTLSAGENYNLTINLENSYLEIVKKPIGITNIYRKYIYNGEEQIPSITLTGLAHIEHEKMIDAGSYYIKVVVDDDNYCLPNDYKDLLIVVEKRDVSSDIKLKLNQFIYTGNNPYIEIENDFEFSVEYYSENDELLENAIMPGKYKAKIMINDKNKFSNSVFDITIDKKTYVLKDVEIIPHYNKIVIASRDNLEYKINNGDYFKNNEFNWLEELTEYTISVRIREDEIGYASEPIVKTIRTTRNPSTVNRLINILGDSINEYNMLTLKSICNYLNDTNPDDVDEDKYNKYLLVKEKYDNVLNNYEKDVEESNNLTGFMNKSIYSITISLISLLFFFTLKKKFEL